MIPSRGPNTSRRAAPRRKLLLGAAATALAVGLSEVSLRVFGAVTGRPGPEQFLVHSDGLGWRNRPSFAGRHVTAEFDVAVCFDSAGHRCTPEPSPPAEGPRVLAIGDSTTFGWGVEAEETFAARLCGLLRADVENLGVTGYGADQQLLLLREELAASRAGGPRLVLVTHTWNDVVEALQTRLYRRNKPRFVVHGEDLRVVGVPVPRDWLTEHSHLWRALQKQLGAYEVPVLDPDEVASGRDLAWRIYREMHRECASRGIGFVLAGDGADWLRDAAQRDGVAYVDLTATFERLERSGPVRFAHDPHWLPRLHAAVAEELAGAIAARGLLRD